MLSKLVLQNFRSYSRETFEFSSNATLFVGPNAVGKTNILEAIYYLATGKSLRASEEKEVIRDGETVGRVIGEIGPSTELRVKGIREVGDAELEIIWDNRPDSAKATGGQGRFHKLYKVNGVGKRQVDFVGHLLAVLFQPTDIEIVIGTPSTRRHYLDSVLSQAHKDYRVAHHIYERALRQRNRILYRCKKEGLAASGEQLEYWNELLITNGKVIHNYRKEYLDFVNSHTDNFFALELVYDHSIVSAERLNKYRTEEILAGTTLVGPHRDDFVIKFKSRSRFKFTRELAKFGSRGEQRLGVFTLKIAEVDYIEGVTSQRPLLLLDDIFSELDKDNRHHVFEFISRQQTIMTTTDIHKEEETLLKKVGAEEIRLT